MGSAGRVDFMATTNITMRIDTVIKAQLQELMSDLGLDIIHLLKRMNGELILYLTRTGTHSDLFQILITIFRNNSKCSNANRA